MKNKKGTPHNNTISSILKGEFIIGKSNRKLIPFLLMLVILGLVNIRSSFRYEELQDRSIELDKEVANLRLTYITQKSKLMSIQKRSEIEKKVLSQGLKTSLNPPEIIYK